jgi:hypothetical protein
MPLEGGGIARWEHSFSSSTIEDPTPCLSVEIIEHASIKAVISDAVGSLGARVERLGGGRMLGRLGGKKVAERMHQVSTPCRALVRGTVWSQY